MASAIMTFLLPTKNPSIRFVYFELSAGPRKREMEPEDFMNGKYFIMFGKEQVPHTADDISGRDSFRKMTTRTVSMSMNMWSYACNKDDDHHDDCVISMMMWTRIDSSDGPNDLTIRHDRKRTREREKTMDQAKPQEKEQAGAPHSS